MQLTTFFSRFQFSLNCLTTDTNSNATVGPLSLYVYIGSAACYAALLRNGHLETSRMIGNSKDCIGYCSWHKSRNIL